LRTVLKSDSTGVFQSLAEDTDHAIWAEFSGPHVRLVRIEDFRVREEFKPPQLPPAFSVVADTHGGVWVSLFDGTLMHYQKGEWQKVSVEPLRRKYQPRIGGIFNMSIDSDGTLWGASGGVVGYRNGNLQLLNERNGLPCSRAYSTIADLDGNLWIQAQCGLVRIEHSELERWWMNPESRLKVSTLTAIDGFRPGIPYGRPAATRDTDGKLWFHNQNAVIMIDPKSLAGNTIIPPVHVEQVIADRKTYPAQSDLRLPAKTHQLELDYTGLSFVVPSRVFFRYMLEGYDTQWQEPGTRRAAFYNDLRPGTYTFRVVACNNSGIWNTAGASLHFTIPPAWFQTYWFLALCAAITFFIAWALYRMRLRQVAKAMSVRFDDRLSERTRIARDLHDTLLQTIQGSKLVADSALKQSSDPSRMHGALTQLSVWLGRATEEGRAALNSLRTSTTEVNDLAEAFRRAIEECRQGNAMEASFSVTGDAREMHPIVRDEVYRIGYEAIRNACAHSQASRLQVTLTYAEELGVRVSDNGVGIDPLVADRGKDGHFGLQGMRERAARIAGKLTVASSPSSGTEVKLVVPGKIIYRKTASDSEQSYTKS
jgi:signal transduction histidine kinase